ncbi:Cell division control 2 isoform 1 [Hibiscus syriacus]|uniref:Cell division control 2 isoform 1 n=1 Tax=Hibiscus syriacus TaxID=106335 RepID=A0A6A2WW80_HIBSY|nr:Cell division control 2 isoform 1 [Hibiscus syriacus]
MESEFALWYELILLLDRVRLDSEMDDCYTWKGNGEGLYSVKSCTNLFSSFSTPELRWSKLVWAGLMPSKVEGAVLWTVWKCRNDIVFENGRFFKLNIDGAVNFDWRYSGIGGVLRDVNSKRLKFFSRSTGLGPPILAELKAIHAGLDLFLKSTWRDKGSLILESDSYNALKWISNPESCSDLYVNLRYDPDPAAKATAATVLASKLGADSGLKFYVEDESKPNVLGGKSNDVEVVPSSGLRKRKQIRPHSTACTPLVHSDDKSTPHSHAGNEVPWASEQGQVIVNHQPPQGPVQDGGWLARLAALLVGEDPTQLYALICCNCRMHNPVKQICRCSSLPINLLNPKGADDAVGNSCDNMDEGALTNYGLVRTSSEIEEVAQKLLSGAPAG